MSWKNMSWIKTSWQSKAWKISLLCLVVAGLTGTSLCAEQPGNTTQATEPPAGWVLKFSDDFERIAIGKNWKTARGDWSIRDGWLTGSGFSEKEIFCNKTFEGSQRLEFDAKTAETPCDLSGFINATPDGLRTAYFVGFGSENNTCSKLLIAGSLVKEWPSTITPGKVYHQVVQRDGNTITHIINGKTVMTHQHDQPLTGPEHNKIGLYIFSLGQFDNVKIYTKPNK